MSKNILDESSGINTLFTKRFTNIPSKVHYINAFKL
ncbi:unknown [Parabacteroides merdae CAG:48]|nr:unknown [Parabacteroides merdae CAG:48]